MADEFLGVGWGFPLMFTDGRLELAVYDESIQQAIRIILETARGERVMRPGFGCGLHERVFAINDASTRAAVAGSKQTDAAKRLIAFLTSGPAAATIRRFGMEPPGR